MTERKDRIQDQTETARLPWICPKLRKLDAGSAETNHNTGPDLGGLS